MSVAAAHEGVAAPPKYQALKCPVPEAAHTWAILDRDGANRQVDRYLSSLGLGETGTGVIVSPAFRIAADAITFTICGHDGPGGGQKVNFLALVDAGSGAILRQAMAPGSDAMQEKSWSVADLRDRQVRIEVRDGDPKGAFAWLGIGRIDAGPAMQVDFRKGLAPGWTQRAESAAQPKSDVLRGGIPFLRYPAQYTLVPGSGALEIPCGFSARRLFVLGGTIAQGKPAGTYGTIEIVYRSGASDTFPLVFGYTLDAHGKMLSKSKAVYLHESADPFQHYLVIGPRPEAIEKVILRRQEPQEGVPRITAVTCETEAACPTLLALPAGAPSAEEEAWIASHTITAQAPALEQIRAEIRRAHKME